jgi:thiamine pyrophosphokinase
VARPNGAIVLADGDAPSRQLLDATWPGWDDGTAVVVAADGGARHAAPLGLHVDAWVGDGDSLEPAALAALEAGGAAIHRVPVEKDATDTELAVELARGTGAERLVIVGAFGGPRLDHALANLSILEGPRLAGLDWVAFDASATRIRLIVAPEQDRPAERSFGGRVGDLVTLLPVGGTARGVTTSNLRFPLAAEDLELGRTRGVSNVRTAPEARLRLESGRLLVIETPVTVES